MIKSSKNIFISSYRCRIKKAFLLLILSFSTIMSAQVSKDSLLKRDILKIVEELDFMYGYDQLLREYTIYKTFDKSKIDLIETLPDSLRVNEVKSFESEDFQNHIWKDYINEKDSIHTERLIEITQEYGFPSTKRIREYYEKEFSDPELNAVVMICHSPKIFREELKILMKSEYEKQRINQCQYGFILWHLTGRKSWQPMLDNGYVLVKEDGIQILKSTCE